MATCLGCGARREVFADGSQIAETHDPNCYVAARLRFAALPWWERIQFGVAFVALFSVAMLVVGVVLFALSVRDGKLVAGLPALIAVVASTRVLIVCHENLWKQSV